MLKYIFSQHLRTPEGQCFSLFYRKDLRPGLRIMLKETSSFSIKNGNLKNPEQDASGHLLLHHMASVITREGILQYAWLTAEKEQLTAAEG